MTDLDILAIARFMYRFGDPCMEDADYDELVRKVRASGQQVNPIYEDDPIPFDLLRSVGIPDSEIYRIMQKPQPFEHSDQYYDIVDESASMSIRSVTTFREAYDWFNTLPDGVELIFTPKIDGINTRRGYEYEDGMLKYRVALTRGRSSDSIDVTRNMGFITQHQVPVDDIAHNLVVYSETFCKKMDIPDLVAKYNTPLKIPRNAGLSMMRSTDYEQSDYDKLHTLVFRCDVSDTLSGGLDWAKAHGFKTVPYTLKIWNSGMSYEDFSQEISKLIASVKGYTDSLGWPTDGIVVEINSRSLFTVGEIKDNYSSSNLALKIGLWKPGIYQSTVRNIEILPQDDDCNCVAIVDPVTTSGGQEVKRVNLFNPAIMIANKIVIGSKITFQYKNETTVDLIQEEVTHGD